MSTKKIEQWEVERYWEIFSSLSNGGTHLNGAQAATVLKNSQLSEDQLAKVWDLADVDNDGSLDFEEFCVAMRLIFDLVNGELSSVPTTLPDWLVPSSKAHLVAANTALSQPPGSFSSGLPSPPLDDDTPGLKDGFDWYMPPGEKRKYEEIYTASRDSRGEISFDSLSALYSSLDVPDSDINFAWNLVNPSSKAKIAKDACIAYLHILNGRHEGFRVPRSVPPSLRSTFERGNIDYNVERARSPLSGGGGSSRYEENTSSGRKAKFGDTYLSRLGVGGGGRSSYSPAGTDFGSVKSDPEWEEVRLKKELRDLEAKIERVEKDSAVRKAGGGGGGGGAGGRDSKAALVRRELEQMLDWKRRELNDMKDGKGLEGGKALKGIREDVGNVREQVEGLEHHLRERERILEELKREVDDEKSSRR
ncbi:endocytosis defective- protein [Agyrium rufum]|nr:endocytosis defective- protein [Agyrium rufum]